MRKRRRRRKDNKIYPKCINYRAELKNNRLKVKSEGQYSFDSFNRYKIGDYVSCDKVSNLVDTESKVSGKRLCRFYGFFKYLDNISLLWDIVWICAVLCYFAMYVIWHDKETLSNLIFSLLMLTLAWIYNSIRKFLRNKRTNKIKARLSLMWCITSVSLAFGLPWMYVIIVRKIFNT